LTANLKAEMKFAYYPGCSLHATGIEYDESTRAVFRALEVGLAELDDWSCCGASSGHNLSALAAVALPARNIALAQKENLDLLAPCAACFNRLKVSEHTLKTDPARRVEIERALGFEYSGSIRIRNPLDLIVSDIGLARVRALVRHRLSDLRLVSYYGCLLVRPPKVVEFDDPDHPLLLDRLLAALGAAPIDWAYATVCCGGSLSLTRPKIVRRLVSDLVAHAREVGAQALVTACPLCQMNLEMRQDGKSTQMPVIYFTELIGLAFGLRESAGWWSKHLIDPQGVVGKYANML
jgi:heterodisulfide reductase subunit B